MSTLAQATLNTQSVAFQFGQRDALRNEPCVPEMIFIARKDQVDYCAGYESVKGVSATTRQFTGSELPQPIIVANLKANGRERVRRTDGNVATIFQAGAARDRRIQRAIEETAAFLNGALAGDIIFA